MFRNAVGLLDLPTEIQIKYLVELPYEKIAEYCLLSKDAH